MEDEVKESSLINYIKSMCGNICEVGIGLGAMELKS